jgi:hypothetical protein
MIATVFNSTPTVATDRLLYSKLPENVSEIRGDLVVNLIQYPLFLTNMSRESSFKINFQ